MVRVLNRNNGFACAALSERGEAGFGMAPKESREVTGNGWVLGVGQAELLKGSSRVALRHFIGLRCGEESLQEHARVVSGDLSREGAAD